MKAKPKKGEQPRCRKCGNPARYYGPVGGYSVQCESCNRHQSTLRRAAAARRREAQPKKKPRRVVLDRLFDNCGCICETCQFLKKREELIGDWKELRLVVEVLK